MRHIWRTLENIEQNKSFCSHTTVKFLNFQTQENLTIKTKMPNLRVFHLKDENAKANSEDPDQTAPLGG